MPVTVTNGGRRQATVAVLTAPGKPLDLQSVDLLPPSSGEVLVRLLASGVCHSDLHVADGEWPQAGPIVLGHEAAGIVEDLGADVSVDYPTLTVGTLVTLAWIVPCDRCGMCCRGETWLCDGGREDRHRRTEAISRLRDGAGRPVGAYCGLGTFASHAVVDAGAAIPIDPATPPHVAAIIGCAAATGAGAVLNAASVRAGASVGIVGLGGVGLSALLAARLVGADPVVAFDLVAEKVALAVDLGARGVTVEPAAAANQRPGEAGDLDWIIDCAGTPTSVSLSLALVRPGGGVVVVGMGSRGRPASVDLHSLVIDAKRVIGSTLGSTDPRSMIPLLARLHSAGRMPLDRLVSKEFELGEVNSALSALRRGSPGRQVLTIGAPA